MATPAAADAESTPVCSDPAHAGGRVRKRGTVRTAAGLFQRYECIPVGGDRHSVRVLIEPVPAPAVAPRSVGPKVPCPNKKHAGSRVRSRGTREVVGQTWRRYSCVRPGKGEHYFQVLIDATGSVLPSMTPPPPCAEHPGSKVIRFGSFGGGNAKRQRYQCQPAEGAPHTFSPALSREVVAAGTEHCSTCDELLSPHRGALTGARHTPWLLKTIAVALNDLSLGSSYASVSLGMRARRDRAIEHLRSAHGITLNPEAVDETSAADGGDDPLLEDPFAVQPAVEVTPARAAERNSRSRATAYRREQGQRAWHLAADLVEQYAPLVVEHALSKTRRAALAQRQANDELLAAEPDAVLETPVVFVLDELQVTLSDRAAKKTSKDQSKSWFVLAVVEVTWHAARRGRPAQRENRIRLLRAYPTPSAEAWQLVLRELDVRPDFVVADAGHGIKRAMERHWGSQVRTMPSLWHIHTNLRDGLIDLPGTWMRVQGRKTLKPELAKYLDAFTRNDITGWTTRDSTQWWDGLIAATAKLTVPVARLVEQRAFHEPRILEAVELLKTHPHLPASNAPIENALRVKLHPFLSGRSHLMRNLARTNFLFDLLVAREHDAFLDLDELVTLIRDHNESAGGWAPAPRLLGDAQPAPRPDGSRSRYSSLLNPSLVPALARRYLSMQGGDDDDAGPDA